MPALFTEKVTNDRHAFGRIGMLYFFFAVLLVAPVGAILPTFASDKGFPALGTDLTHFFSLAFSSWEFLHTLRSALDIPTQCRCS